jgi:hypothetical protein
MSSIYTQSAYRMHNQICHTKVKGVKVWKCPFYEICKFGVSNDLLKNYGEWNLISGKFSYKKKLLRRKMEHGKVTKRRKY